MTLLVTHPSPGRRARPAAALGALLAVVGLLCLLAPAGRAAGRASVRRAPQIASEQSVALIDADHAVYASPTPGARYTGRVVPARGPITGEQTALPVLARRTDSHGVRWLRVRLAGRPDGITGWIHQGATRLTETPWHLVVDLDARTVTVYLLGTREQTFRAVVGKPSSPTPIGQFFIQETVRMAAGDPGGPYALALSARSNTYTEFDGGPGQVAIHGRDLLGGTLGDAQSHGCVRLASASITWLAYRIRPGVPVTIQTR